MIQLVAISALIIGSALLPIINGEINEKQDITMKKSIDFLSQPPTGPFASFNFTPQNPMVNEIVNLDASESNYPVFDPEIEVEIIGYKWDLTNNGIFDDATGETIQHSWSQEGTYTVNLKVVGNLGINDTTERIIEIYRPTEISIESIFIENGRVSAEIQNVGEGYCTVDWRITVSGGLFGYVSAETTSTSVLESGDTQIVTMDQDAIGFGFVNIGVEAKAINADDVNSNTQGFLIGSYLIIL